MSERRSMTENDRDSMLSSTESFIVEAGQALAIAFRHASFGVAQPSRRPLDHSIVSPIGYSTNGSLPSGLIGRI